MDDRVERGFLTADLHAIAHYGWIARGLAFRLRALAQLPLEGQFTKQGGLSLNRGRAECHEVLARILVEQKPVPNVDIGGSRFGSIVSGPILGAMLCNAWAA